MNGVRTFGMLWCPPCAMLQEFVGYHVGPGEPEVQDVNDAECHECGYQFGYKVDERVISEDGTRYEMRREGVISKQVADAALKAMTKGYRDLILSSGARLEEVNRRIGHG